MASDHDDKPGRSHPGTHAGIPRPAVAVQEDCGNEDGGQDGEVRPAKHPVVPPRSHHGSPVGRPVNKLLGEVGNKTAVDENTRLVQGEAVLLQALSSS